MKPHLLRMLSIAVAFMLTNWVTPSGSRSACEARGHAAGVRSARFCRRQARKSARLRRECAVPNCPILCSTDWHVICPLWEVYEVPGTSPTEWIYYGEYYEFTEDCPGYPQSAYLQEPFIAAAPVDCEANPGNCRYVGGNYTSNYHRSSRFPGHNKPITESTDPKQWMHPDKRHLATEQRRRPVTIQLPASDGERTAVIYHIQVPSNGGASRSEKLYYGFETGRPAPPTAFPVKYIDEWGNNPRTRSKVVRGTFDIDGAGPEPPHQYVIFLRQ